MKRRIHFIGLLITLFLINSCSSIYIIGNDFNDFRVDEIAIGESNNSQILGMFGEPSRVGKINDLEVFVYSYEEYEFPSQSVPITKVDRRYKSLIVFFNEESVVSNYIYNVPVSSISLDMIILDRMKKQQEENENPSYDN